MPDYLEITFSGISEEQSQLLLAKLNEAGFDGFEEEPGSLKAFILHEKYEKEAVTEIGNQLQLNFTEKIIREENWNALWESNFEPVTIDNCKGDGRWVLIRAHFHEPIQDIPYEIIITPKMSFGTGHHATTSLMIRHMSGLDVMGKKVLDFGTGTGILAILSEKLGASAIVAIDNDDWSIENAAENFSRNDCTKVTLQKAADAYSGEKFDLILANINKNVIVDNFQFLAGQLAPDGLLLLSGLLIDDEREITVLARKFSMTPGKKTAEQQWLCISYTR